MSPGGWGCGGGKDGQCVGRFFRNSGSFNLLEPPGLAEASIGIALPLPLFRLRLKCDGTRAESRFRLSAKRTCPFKSAGASVQSTTGRRGVRISGSNAGCTMFRGRVHDYWLPTPLACFPFTSPTVRHRVPSGFN